LFFLPRHPDMLFVPDAFLLFEHFQTGVPQRLPQGSRARVVIPFNRRRHYSWITLVILDPHDSAGLQHAPGLGEVRLYSRPAGDVLERIME